MEEGRFGCGEYSNTRTFSTQVFFILSPSFLRSTSFIAPLTTGEFYTCICRGRPQGVNSALEDVVVLERALESCGDCVETALPAYEQARAADSKALVRVRLGFFP